MCAKCAARPLWSLLVLEDVNTTGTKRANTNNIRTSTILSTAIELKRTRIRKINNHVIKLLHV